MYIASAGLNMQMTFKGTFKALSGWTDQGVIYPPPPPSAHPIVSMAEYLYFCETAIRFDNTDLAKAGRGTEIGHPTEV